MVTSSRPRCSLATPTFWREEEGPNSLAPFLPSAWEVGGAVHDSTHVPLLGGSCAAAKQRSPAGEAVPPTEVGGAEQPRSEWVEQSGRRVALLPVVTLRLSQVPSESASRLVSKSVLNWLTDFLVVGGANVIVELPDSVVQYND